MSWERRLDRSIERGLDSPKLRATRADRDERQHEKWLSGILVKEIVYKGGFILQTQEPAGKGLIHNGRKP